MKFVLKNILLFISFFLTPLLFAQDIQVITYGTTKYEPVGTQEIVFDFEVVNVSTDTLVVFEVRTLNNLPPDWTSSLCFGQLCFPPDRDSIATTPPIPEPPLAPGDTLITSLHVNTDLTSIATAYIQMQVGTFRNPEDRIILDFTATTDPTVSVKENLYLNEYYLSQNYPNPFNPATTITYSIPKESQVSLKIYDVVGREVAELVSGKQSSGSYNVEFDAASLASGVYIYRMIAGDFSSVKKMNVLK